MDLATYLKNRYNINDAIDAAINEPEINLKNSAGPNKTYYEYNLLILSRYKNPRTLDYILKNPHYCNNWYFNSANPGITMKDVYDNPTLKWSWMYLSINPNITINDVLNNPNYNNKHYNYLSSNPGIKMNDVLNNPNKPWNYRWLSLNPSITMTDVQNNPNKPWSLNSLSLNPNITLEFIDQFINFDSSDKLNLSYLLKYNKLTVVNRELTQLFLGNFLNDDVARLISFYVY